MDPTQTLAARHLHRPRGNSRAEIDAFYAAHGHDGPALARAALARLAAALGTLRIGPRFVARRRPV